jgi:hypothetical protein
MKAIFNKEKKSEVQVEGLLGNGKERRRQSAKRRDDKILRGHNAV